MVEEEERREGWVFQHREGDSTKTSDMGKGFRKMLRRVKLEEVGLIHYGGEVEEYMSLRRSSRRGLITGVLNNRLGSSVIEADIIWRKRERVRGG